MRLALPAAAVLWSMSLLSALPSTLSAVEWNPGDRIVLVGGAFMERLQAHGYFETMLSAAYPRHGLQFRNLGWSGDTVWGEARAVFGSTEDGFRRLEKDLLEAQPTVILACYGNNEAHAGEAGLPRFKAGVRQLFELFAQTQARVVVISPRPYETLGPPLPNPRDYNRTLAAYAEVLRKEAAHRGFDWVNIFDEVGGRLTDNGVHLTPFGHWRMAARLTREFGVRPTAWHVDLDLTLPALAARDTLVQDWQRTERGVRFTTVDRYLEPPAPPSDGPPRASLLSEYGSVRVRGLPPGQYTLQIDGQAALTAPASAWAIGLDLPFRGGAAQVEAVRQLVLEKDQFYFHRYRPQNETYLFLFRKHEQGNNAVEIPQFDPLVQAREAAIAARLLPQSHQYEWIRQEE